MRHPFMLGALLALLATSQVACVVGPRFTRCPGEGGRPWTELDGEHYTLQTDLPLDEARKAMGYLERTRVALLAAAWPGSLREEMAKVTVYVLADSNEYKGLYPRRMESFFIRYENEAVIVLHGKPASWERRFSGLSVASASELKHELTHHLSTYALVRQPRWLSEGLAEYLETLHVAEDGRTAVVGLVNLDAFTELRGLEWARRIGRRDWKPRDVLTWEGGDNPEEEWRTAAHYAGSWLLVHWLYSKRPAEFAEYQGLLAQGADPDEALRRVLPEVLAPELDAVLFEYLRGRSWVERRVTVPPVGMSFIERPLEDAEVHVIRSKLAVMAAGLARQEQLANTRTRLAKAELDEALRLDPNSVLALWAKLRTAPESERPGIARLAVEAHPDDSEAWLLLASALAGDRAAQTEQEQAYRKALELDARDARAPSGLAWLYVTQGRFEEALPLAKRAVELAPWSPHVLDTYAMASAGMGACAEAIQTEQRALQLLQEHPDPVMEKLLRERLATLSQEACAPP